MTALKTCMTTRQFYSMAGFLLAAAIAVTGFYFELFLDYQPCILCVIQRAIFVGIAAMFLVTYLIQFWRSGSLTVVLTIILSTVGMLASLRQLYLQAMPTREDEVCVPGITFVFHQLPFFDAVKYVALGSSECGIVEWSFLGVTMAGWSLIFFSVLLAFCVVELRTQKVSCLKNN